MALCYEVVIGEILDGIPVSDCGAILLGDPGSGGDALPVKVPVGSMSTMTGGRLLELEGHGLVVLLRDQSGDRGSWAMVAPHTDEDWDAWVEGGRIDAALRPTGPAAVEILAEGWRHQGGEESPCGGPEYLLRMRHGESVEWRREGRLRCGQRWYRLSACYDGTLSLSSPARQAVSRAHAHAYEED